ncbi:signal peptidase I [Jongsikchunia kroppenstedtii]|uniref:signal peptidase I n=1 Tax=Jongsikchunia kroppenstedtii TaxID=1121721 RepID=UPI00039CBDED|nr:signal peptidase I [Jongsikchunia kroppenstedtii]
MTTTQTPAARASTDARAAATNADDETSVWWWARTIGSAALFMAAFAVLMAVVVAPRLGGATAYTILTGSMEPKYPPGTLVVSKPVDPKELRAGEVITFNRPDAPEIVTHRIDEITYTADGQMQIKTRGDNNPSRDPWTLHPDNVRGRLWYAVPYLGRVNSALNGKDKSLVIKLGAGALVLYGLYAFGTSARDRVRRGREEQPAAPDAASAPPVEPQPATAIGPRVLPPSQQPPVIPPAPTGYPAPTGPPPHATASPYRVPLAGTAVQQAPMHREPAPWAAWPGDAETTAPIPVINHPVAHHPVAQHAGAHRPAYSNQQRSHAQ